MSTSISEIAHLWHPETVYLNTASFGLPPDPSWDAMQAALDDYRHGRTSWEPWGDMTHRARALFAQLVGVDEANVATGTTVSGFTGLVAASFRMARACCSRRSISRRTCGPG